MRCSRSVAVIVLAGAVIACAGQSEGQVPKAPSATVLEQVLEKRLLGLRPTGFSERNVLFQSVLAGKPDRGEYPFRVSLLIRDYGAGYPANRFYGETCVGHVTDWDYTLSPDQFGGWAVDGRMTPDNTQLTCTPNPSAGVSSVPLAGLPGTPAPAGPIASPAAAVPAGGRGAAVTPPGSIAAGSYECWSNGEARSLSNFSVSDATHYTGSDGKVGTYTFNATTTRIVFKGGALDGVLPAGFYTIYHSVQGRPVVSFMSPSGTEAQYCEKD